MIDQTPNSHAPNPQNEANPFASLALMAQFTKAIEVLAKSLSHQGRHPSAYPFPDSYQNPFQKQEYLGTKYNQSIIHTMQQSNGNNIVFFMDTIGTISIWNAANDLYTTFTGITLNPKKQLLLSSVSLRQSYYGLQGPGNVFCIREGDEEKLVILFLEELGVPEIWNANSPNIFSGLMDHDTGASVKLRDYISTRIPPRPVGPEAIIPSLQAIAKSMDGIAHATRDAQPLPSHSNEPGYIPGLEGLAVKDKLEKIRQLKGRVIFTGPNNNLFLLDFSRSETMYSENTMAFNPRTNAVHSIGIGIGYTFEMGKSEHISDVGGKMHESYSIIGKKVLEHGTPVKNRYVVLCVHDGEISVGPEIVSFSDNGNLSGLLDREYKFLLARYMNQVNADLGELPRVQMLGVGSPLSRPEVFLQDGERQEMVIKRIFRANRGINDSNPSFYDKYIWNEIIGKYWERFVTLIFFLRDKKYVGEDSDIDYGSKLDALSRMIENSDGAESHVAKRNIYEYLGLDHPESSWFIQEIQKNSFVNFCDQNHL